jgi:AcrR family transcriptional regulator
LNRAGALRAVADFPHGRVPAAVRSQQLLDVAERLFATAGYAATSIEAIAAQAGVTRPVVYQRFGSKEGIYLACLKRARSHMEAMLAEAVAGADSLEGRIERAADAYFRFVEQDPARWRVLFGGDAAISGTAAEEAMQMHLATERRFAELFAIEAGKQDEQRLLAYSHAVGGAAHQLAQWWLRTPEVTRDQVVGWYMHVVWSGLSSALGGLD